MTTAALLAFGVDAAGFAATGDSLLLGRFNEAGKTTTIENNGRGAALRLVTRPAAPPLKVNSLRKVRRLHADRLDGFEGRQLTTTPTVYTDTDETQERSSFEAWTFALQPGTYGVSYQLFGRTAATPFSLVCLLNDDGSVYGIQSASLTPGFSQFGVSGSDIIEVTDETEIDFYCATSGSDPYTLDGPLRIAVTALNGADVVPIDTDPAARSQGRPRDHLVD